MASARVGVGVHRERRGGGRRRCGGAGTAQGRGRVRDADRGALGQPDPRGAAPGQGRVRDRVHLVGKRVRERFRPGAQRLRRAGPRPDHGQFLRHRADHPPGRARLPRGGVRVRLGHRAGGAQLRRVRQLDPRAGLSRGHDRGQAHQLEHRRHRGSDADPRGQPPLQCFLRRRQGGQRGGQVQVLVHRLVLRSAQGQGSGDRPDRGGRRRDLRRALRRDRGGGRARHPGDRQHVRPVRARARHRGHQRRLGHVADRQAGDQPGPGRRVHGAGLRPVLLHGQGRLVPRALSRWEDKLPDDVKAMVVERTQEIMDGTFRVPVDESTPQSE